MKSTRWICKSFWLAMFDHKNVSWRAVFVVGIIALHHCPQELRLTFPRECNLFDKISARHKGQRQWRLEGWPDGTWPKWWDLWWLTMYVDSTLVSTNLFTVLQWHYVALLQKILAAKNRFGMVWKMIFPLGPLLLQRRWVFVAHAGRVMAALRGSPGVILLALCFQAAEMKNLGMFKVGAAKRWTERYFLDMGFVGMLPSPMIMKFIFPTSIITFHFGTYPRCPASWWHLQSSILSPVPKIG